MFDVLKEYPLMIAKFLIVNVFGLSAKSKLAGALIFATWQSIRAFVLLFVLLFLFSLATNYLRRIRKTQESSLFKTENGMIGIFMGTILGFLTPTAICSTSVVPIFLSLVGAGVPRSLALSFLIVSPLVNIATLSVVLATLGFHNGMIYAGASLAVAMIGGFLLSRFRLTMTETSVDFSCQLSSERKENSEPLLKTAARYALQVLQKIWYLLIIGFLLAGFMNNYIPSSWMQALGFLGNYISVIIAVIAGLPLFASIASMAPVGAQLIKSGVPLGTTFSFIMAVSGISIPGLLLLRKLFLTKSLVIIVSVLSLSILVVGLTLNLIV